MNCTIQPLRSIDEEDISFIYRRLTRAGSDFQAKLSRGVFGDDDGVIAIVRDAGEIVAWARTGKWRDPMDAAVYDTLEAFTRIEWRRRGVCRYAVSGLVAAAAFGSPVAVFNTRMAAICRRLEVAFVEYQMQRAGWTRAR